MGTFLSSLYTSAYNYLSISRPQTHPYAMVLSFDPYTYVSHPIRICDHPICVCDPSHMHICSNPYAIVLRFYMRAQMRSIWAKTLGACSLRSKQCVYEILEYFENFNLTHMHMCSIPYAYVLIPYALASNSHMEPQMNSNWAQILGAWSLRSTLCVCTILKHFENFKVDPYAYVSHFSQSY